LHEQIQKPAQYICLVRHPVDREISDANFAYQRNYIESEQVESYLLDKMLDNPQVRMIAGREYMKGPCTEETFAKAIKNIEKDFLLIAPSEEIDTFLQILSTIQKWGPIAYAPMQITQQKAIDRPSEALKQQLLDKHQWDLKLYEWVNTHWAAVKEKMILNPKTPDGPILTFTP
jgi:hypothetical protein